MVLQSAAGTKTHEFCSQFWYLWVLLPIFEEIPDRVAESPVSVLLYLQDLHLGISGFIS